MDGSVVCWGDPRDGGDCSLVQHQLVKVQQVQSTLSAFAAILEDGSVVCWGDPRNGGDNSEVQQHLKDVVSIAATSFAFAAILADQSVIPCGRHRLCLRSSTV